ncbi:MAG TPA: small ribosomal subunit biogenesis GTPase RsgA [Pseudomonadales bacterium]|nr:small ribosomal subunit biogenesis GTPase RsgA [Pseudomonadales bacterium]
MARRLTDQQRRRIAQHQMRQREAAGSTEKTVDESGLGSEQEALVIAHYGRKLDVEHPDDATRIVRCSLRANITQLVTGDHVIVRLPVAGSEAGATGLVVAGCERRTLLSRPDSRGLLRPIAANIDAMLITIAPLPEPFPFLIDRYLVAADLYGIQPVILCNKTDLINDDNRAAIEKLLHVYRTIGYPVFLLSSYDRIGLTAVADFLRTKTSVIVGQSGVGKSSLINALLPGVDVTVGALSTASDKGKHTTTTARLYHLPQGGDLIDSPGIREFTLQQLPAQELLSHFVDLRAYTDGCKFRDCSHEHEPGCALLAAEQDGKFFPERLASYRHILANLNTH